MKRRPRRPVTWPHVLASPQAAPTCLGHDSSSCPGPAGRARPLRPVSSVPCPIHAAFHVGQAPRTESESGTWDQTELGVIQILAAVSRGLNGFPLSKPQCLHRGNGDNDRVLVRVQATWPRWHACSARSGGEHGTSTQQTVAITLVPALHGTAVPRHAAPQTSQRPPRAALPKSVTCAHRVPCDSGAVRQIATLRPAPRLQEVPAH